MVCFTKRDNIQIDMRLPLRPLPDLALQHAEVMRRLHSLSQKHKDLYDAIRALPEDASEHHISALDATIRQYYVAARGVHFDDIEAKDGSSQVNDPSEREHTGIELGEAFRIRRRKSDDEGRRPMFRRRKGDDDGGRRRKRLTGEEVDKIEAALRRRSNSPMFHAAKAKANVKCGGCLSRRDVGKKKAKVKAVAVKGKDVIIDKAKEFMDKLGLWKVAEY